MSKEDSKIGYCPSCNQPAIKRGNEIICENCDASFQITRKGAKVKELGPFDDLKERVTKIEQCVFKEDEPEPPQEDEDEDL